MKPNFLYTSLAMLALALFAIPAVANADGAPPNPTALSIKTTPVGLYGILRAPNDDCGEGRGIDVYRMRGDHRDPGEDRLVDRAIAGHVGRDKSDLYMWSTQIKRGEGTYYAVASDRKGCAEVESDHLDSSFENSDPGHVPECPKTEASSENVCFINFHLDASVCPSFTAATGGNPFPCLGTTTGTPAWSTTADLKALTYGALFWFPIHGGPERIVAYKRLLVAAPIAGVEGRMAGPGYKPFEVTLAYSALPSAKSFATPPGSKVDAGQLGGPLSFKFENGIVGADIFISGFMYAI